MATLISRVPPREDWLNRAIIAGFIASVVMASLFVAAYGLARLAAPSAPSPAQGADVFAGWLYALTHNAVLDLAAASLFGAAAIHLIVGVLWAIVYAYYFEPRLPGNASARGAIFSFLPWVLSLVVFMPLVGGGLFGMATGAGPLPAIGNLILHLSYGLTLGALYSPLGDLSAHDLSEGTQDDRETVQNYERAGRSRAHGRRWARRAGWIRDHPGQSGHPAIRPVIARHRPHGDGAWGSPGRTVGLDERPRPTAAPSPFPLTRFPNL